MKKSYIEPKVKVHRLRCESLLQNISDTYTKSTVPNDFGDGYDGPEENGSSESGVGLND